MYSKQSAYMGVVLLLILLSVLIAGCSTSSSPEASPTATPPEQKTLTVFAAASLSSAFNETMLAYEANHTNVDVEATFLGTQQLRTQIEQGAEADVFASASASHMTALKNEGFMDNATVADFTKNKLAIIVPKSNPANITSMADLAKSGVKLVICAKSVPCGQYTLDMLNKSVNDSAYGQSFKDNVMKNVVSQEDNVNNAISKVALGEADVAVVYQSDVPTSMHDKVTFIQIPEGLNVIATYPIGVLAGSDDEADAQDFVNFVLSPAGQAILAENGFVALA